MKISVITPVLNGASFIRQTVESVLSQSGDFELDYIIRDGGSTDGTLEILEDYRERCRIVSEADGSPQAAINRGMAMAEGEIGAWLNADDIYQPEALQAAVTFFRQNPERRWCYGSCSIIDEENKEIRKPVTWYKNLLASTNSWNMLLCENFISQPSAFWRLDLWHEVGGLSSYIQAAWDYALWLECWQRGGRPGLLRKRMAAFRRHRQSISEKHFITQFREEAEIAGKYGNGFHRLVHGVNQKKITTVYRILNWRERNG